jgi:hypothetical protein
MPGTMPNREIFTVHADAHIDNAQPHIFSSRGLPATLNSAERS